MTSKMVRIAAVKLVEFLILRFCLPNKFIVLLFEIWFPSNVTVSIERSASLLVEMKSSIFTLFGHLEDQRFSVGILGR